MKKNLVWVIVLLFLQAASFAQNKASYEKRWFVEKNDSLPYRLLLPENYDARKKYPLILFLHGAGERGNDNERQLVHGAWLFLTDSFRKKYPAIVVFPQCPANSFWSNVNFIPEPVKKNGRFDFPAEGDPTPAMRLLLGFLKDLQQNFNLDKHHMYVGGLSMGGMGTFELVRRKPKLFAAAFPICGGGNPSTAEKLKHVHWWIFHGLKDDVVDPELSTMMATALKEKGADVKLTLYPNANHNSWDAAFAEKDLLPWLFSNKRLK